MRRVLLAALILCRSALAADGDEASADAVDPEAVRAEYVRLHQEIVRLAEKDHWEGVELSYKKAMATGIPLVFEDHMAGASAALALGDVAAARQRLFAAREFRQDDPHVIESLWALDTSFAPVVLKGQIGAVLKAAVVPFQPDQAHAITFAAAQVAETGAFEGFLPAGSYTLAGIPFEVSVREIGADPVLVDALVVPQPKKKKRS